MAETQRKYWFRSKYGFGWYPINIKGWIVFTIYFAFLIYVFIKLNYNSPALSSTLISEIPYFFGGTIILLFICYIMGEPIKIKDLKV
jgi:hypothetical protein